MLPYPTPTRATSPAVHLAERAKQLGAAVANPTTLAWAEYALAEALLDDQPDRARLALDRAVAHARTARNRLAGLERRSRHDRVKCAAGVDVAV